MTIIVRCLFFILLALLAAGDLRAQDSANSHPFSEMRWRSIGPFRAGRTIAVTGVRGQPHTYYAGPAVGGVWKSTDDGHTWQAIFDQELTGAIGAVAVAPSDPNIIY